MKFLIGGHTAMTGVNPRDIGVRLSKGVVDLIDGPPKIPFGTVGQPEGDWGKTDPENPWEGNQFDRAALQLNPCSRQPGFRPRSQVRACLALAMILPEKGDRIETID